MLFITMLMTGQMCSVIAAAGSFGRKLGPATVILQQFEKLKNYALDRLTEPNVTNILNPWIIHITIFAAIYSVINSKRCEYYYMEVSML